MSNPIMFGMNEESNMRMPGLGAYMHVDPNWSDNWMTIEPKEKESPKKEVRISIELIESLETVEAPGAHGDYSSNVWIFNLPFIGRLHILKNRTGFINVAIIVLYWIYGTWCTIYVILKPHYDEGHISAFPALFYSAVSVLCISSLFRASTANPGRIPFSREQPASAEQMTDNHCAECRRRKPHRSHHCSRCGQCILRMDHHCPWINNCVGQENHWMFMQLLWYAFIMSLSSFIYCMLHYYYWPPCETCDKLSFIVSDSQGLTTAMTIMAIFMTMSMAFMLMNQLYSALTVYFVCNYLSFFVACACFLALLMMGGSMSLIMIQGMGFTRDLTTIDWMKLHKEWNKGNWDPSKMPVPTKSLLKAHDDLCGPGPRWLWPFPCRKRRGPLHVQYPEVV